MTGDGSTFPAPPAAATFKGVSLGGRLRGLAADPLAQVAALIIAVSVVFGLFGGIDVWFSGLFAIPHGGFPARGLAAFDILNRAGLVAVAVVAIAALAALGQRLVRPERPAFVAPERAVFVLAGLLAVSCLTPLLTLAASSKRFPPIATDLFGGHSPFVAAWQGGGGCSTDCAAFSIATPWAVWLISAAALLPPAWRRSAAQFLALFAAVAALNTVARGEDYLSGVLISGLAAGLIVMAVYTYTLVRPIPRLADGRAEADLTRLGRQLRAVLSEADWDAVALKAQSPWLDRRSRISPLKAVTLVLVVLPGAWLFYLAVTGNLTPLPWVFLIYNSGIWAIWMFLASLAVTPARHIFGWSELITVRRMLGIAGLAYTVLHLADYVWLDRFSLGFIVNEYLTRPTIWVATLSTAGIFILGATSFDEVIRRMGSAAWNRLHLIAYPAIGLAVLHFDMSPASLGGTPYLIAGMFLWLMAWRVVQRTRLGERPLALVALGLATPVATFLFETVWLDLFQGLPPARTIPFGLNIVGPFDFDFSAGLGEVWQILILGLAAAALGAIFGRKSQALARLRLRRADDRSPDRWPNATIERVGRVFAAPLHDRQGRFSALKAATFALLFVPALWFAWLAATDSLTPQPFGFIIYNSGVWAMWLLLLSLAVTPARHVLRAGELITVRRMIGLAGLGYTLFHIVIYFSLDRTSWATISADLKRLTIIVALLSTAGLLALAATSFDEAIRRLGGRTWNRLHYLAYPAVGLAVLHFDMGPESLGGTPFVITGLYFWVMGWRGLNLIGRGTDTRALLALTLASTLLSFAFEATWIRYYRGFIEFGTVDELWALGLGLAATWQVLLAGLAASLLGAVFADSGIGPPLRRLPASRVPPTKSAAARPATAFGFPAQ